MLPQFDQFVQDGLYLRNWSLKTARIYRQAATSVGAHPCTAEGLAAWVVDARQRGLRPGAINAYIRAVNAYLTWCRQRGMSVPAAVKQLREPVAPPKTVPPKQVAVILKDKPETDAAIRLQSLVLVLLDTGIRIAEALALRRQDVDLDGLLLRVEGKGRKTRVVPLSREGRAALYRWWRQHEGRPTDLVWATKHGQPYEYQNCRRDMLRAYGVTPHQCRHTFASAFIASGGDCLQLQRIMGHCDIKTTLRYVHMQTADLQRAHEAHGGLRQYR